MQHARSRGTAVGPQANPWREPWALLSDLPGQATSGPATGGADRRATEPPVPVDPPVPPPQPVPPPEPVPPGEPPIPPGEPPPIPPGEPPIPPRPRPPAPAPPPGPPPPPSPLPPEPQLSGLGTGLLVKGRRYAVTQPRVVPTVAIAGEAGQAVTR
jgi:hypothetical protein